MEKKKKNYIFQQINEDQRTYEIFCVNKIIYKERHGLKDIIQNLTIHLNKVNEHLKTKKENNKVYRIKIKKLKTKNDTLKDELKALKETFQMCQKQLEKAADYRVEQMKQVIKVKEKEMEKIIKEKRNSMEKELIEKQLNITKREQNVIKKKNDYLQLKRQRETKMKRSYSTNLAFQEKFQLMKTINKQMKEQLEDHIYLLKKRMDFLMEYTQNAKSLPKLKEKVMGLKNYNVIKSGWGLKESKLAKKWQPKYFRLYENNILEYFHNEKQVINGKCIYLKPPIETMPYKKRETCIVITPLDKKEKKIYIDFQFNTQSWYRLFNKMK